MRITIFGAGGVGGYLAGKLGALLGQRDSGLSSLYLIARGRHLAAIQEQGLTFIDVEGGIQRLEPSVASGSFADLPDCDVVFLCVKGYDLPDTVDTIARHIDENTLVIPLLNGADIYEQVRARLDTGIVLPGAIYISSAVTEPGTVQHKGGKGLVILGKGAGRDAAKPDVLLSLLEKAGIPFQWSDDPFPAIWSKYLFISPFALATAVSGKTLGAVLEDARLYEDLRGMMEEVAAVARAKGVELPADAVEQTIEKARAFPPETKTSFQRDIEAKKERDERDNFGTAVIRIGKEHDVETATLRKYLEALP